METKYRHIIISIPITRTDTGEVFDNEVEYEIEREFEDYDLGRCLDYCVAETKDTPWKQHLYTTERIIKEWDKNGWVKVLA